MLDEIFESKIVTISLIIVLLSWIISILITICLDLNIYFDPSLIYISFIISIFAALIIPISLIYFFKGSGRAFIIFVGSVIISLVFRIFEAIWGIFFNYVDYFNIFIIILSFLLLLFIYKNFFYLGMFNKEFSKAVKLYEKGEKDNALKIYQNLLRKNKKCHILYYSISLVLWDMGKYEEALLNVDKALKLKPNYHDALYQKGVILDSLEKYDEALLNVDKALKLKPNYHDALHQKGFILMNLEKYDEALIYTDKALKLEENPQLLINKIIILHELKRYDEELKSCDELIKFDSNNEDYHLMKINPLIHLNREKDAFNLVNQILENDENNVNALNDKAWIFYFKRDYLKVLKYLNKSLTIDESNSWALRMKSLILIELAKYDEALKCFKKGYLSIDKNNKKEKELYCDLKRILHYNLCEYEKALECSNECLKLDNKDIGYHLQKIYILKELECEKEAEKCCKHTLIIINEKLKINENNYLLFDKVDVYIQLKECDKAYKLLNSIEIDSIDKYSFNYKGILLKELGHFEEALKNYDKALKIDSENPIFLNNKSFALLKLNKLDESLDALNKALKIIPNFPSSLHNKAYILEKLEKYDEALEYYNKAFEINPYDKELQEDRENFLKKVKE